MGMVPPHKFLLAPSLPFPRGHARSRPRAQRLRGAAVSTSSATNCAERVPSPPQPTLATHPAAFPSGPSRGRRGPTPNVKKRINNYFRPHWQGTACTNATRPLTILGTLLPPRAPTQPHPNPARASLIHHPPSLRARTWKPKAGRQAPNVRHPFLFRATTSSGSETAP